MTDKIGQKVGGFPTGLDTLPPSERHGYFASIYPKTSSLYMARFLLSHPIYLLVFLASVTSPSMCLTNGATSQIAADLSSPTTTSEYVSSLQTTTTRSLSKSTPKESDVINPTSGISSGSTFGTQASDTSPKLGENRDDGYFSGTSISTSVSKTRRKESNLALNSDELRDITLTPAGSEHEVDVAAQHTPPNTHATSSIKDVNKSHTSNEPRSSTPDTVAADEDSSGHFGIVASISDQAKTTNQPPDGMSSEKMYKKEPVVVLNESSTDPTPSSAKANPSNNDTIFNPSSFFIPVSTSSKLSNREHMESALEESTSVSFHKSDEHPTSSIRTTSKAPHTPPSIAGVTPNQETIVGITEINTQITTLQGTADKRPIPPLTHPSLSLTQTKNIPTIPRGWDSTARASVGNDHVTSSTNNDLTGPDGHTTGDYKALMKTVEKGNQTVESATRRSSEITQQMTSQPSDGLLVSINILSEIPGKHVDSEIKSSSKVTEFLTKKHTLTTTDKWNFLESGTWNPNVELAKDLTSSNLEGTITSSQDFQDTTPVTKEYYPTVESKDTSHITTQIALEKRPQMETQYLLGSPSNQTETISPNPATTQKELTKPQSFLVRIPTRPHPTRTNQSKISSLSEESRSNENLTSIAPSTITESSLTEMVTKKSSSAHPSSMKSTVHPTMTTEDFMTNSKTHPQGNIVSSVESVSTRSSPAIPVSSHSSTNVFVSTNPLIVQNTNDISASLLTDTSTRGFQTVLPMTSIEQQERHRSEPKGQTVTTKYTVQPASSLAKLPNTNQTAFPRGGTIVSEPSENPTPRVSMTMRPKSTSPSTTRTLEIATNKSPGTNVASKHLDNMNKITTQSTERTQGSVTVATPSKASQQATASLTDTGVNDDRSEISSPETTLSTSPTNQSPPFKEAIVNPTSSAGDNFKINYTPTHKTPTQMRTTVGIISARLSSETSKPTASTTKSPRNLSNTHTNSNTPTNGTIPDISISSTPTNMPQEHLQETLAKSTAGSLTNMTHTSAKAIYPAPTIEVQKTSKPDPPIKGKSPTDAPVNSYTEPTRNAITLVPNSSTVSYDKRQTTTESESSAESMISTDAPSKRYTGSRTTGEAVEISVKPDQSTAVTISIDATVPSVSQTKSPEDKKRTFETLTGNAPVDITMNPTTSSTTTTTITTKSSEAMSFATSSSTAVPLRSSTYDTEDSLSYSDPTTDKLLEQTTANSYTPTLSVGLTDVTYDILRNTAMHSTATTTETPSILSTIFAEAVTEVSTTSIPPTTHTKRQTNYKVTTTSSVSQGSEETHKVTTSASQSSQLSTVTSTTELKLQTLEAKTSPFTHILTPTTEEQIASHSQTTGLRHIETSTTMPTTKETKPMTEKVTLSTRGSSSTQASSISSYRTSLKTSESTLSTSSSLHAETSLIPTTEGSSTEQQVTECEQLGSDCDLLTENCVNTYGEYKCECKQGYYKNQESVCVAGVSFYGRLRIDSVSRGGSITESVHYTPELKDPNSAIYKELAEEVQNMIDSVFLSDPTSTSTYKGSKIIQFWSGSIVVEFQLTQAGVSTPLNKTVLQLILRNAVDDGTVKNISGFVISSNSVLVTPLDECDKKVHDCSVFATCLDQPIGFSCTCNSGYRDLRYDVIPGRYCQSVERPKKPLTSQMHVIVAIVLTTSVVVLVTVTVLVAFVHKKCHSSRTSSSTVKLPTVTAPRKISDAFLAGDVEAGVWCPAPGEDVDGWSTGSSSSTCPNSKNVGVAPIACIPESEFEIGHDVIGGTDVKKQTACSKSKTSELALDQHKTLNSMTGNTAPSSGQTEGPADRQREEIRPAGDRRC